MYRPWAGRASSTRYWAARWPTAGDATRETTASTRSAWAKAAPAVSVAPLSTTIRSARRSTNGNRRLNAGISHQVVVALAPSSRPAAPRKNVAEHEAATAAPRHDHWRD